MANTPFSPISFTNKFVEECTVKFDSQILTNSTLEDELLSNALEQVGYNKNYKFALRESFIAAEAINEKVLHKIKISKDISNNKLKDYKKEVAISYKLNIELKLVLENLTTKEIEILDKIDIVRKKRNGVVHEAASVSMEEALSAINSVYDLIEMLQLRTLK